MTLDDEGMVMNWNDDTLPEDCHSISRDYAFEVRAGTRYAKDYNGTIFGMSQHEFRVEPCSRITITFINDDEVRHQFMVHQLPKYLYPQGMFHLEAAGGATKKGTFIVPSDNRTYLVHCDLAQHMEKGMKGQLVVGRGGLALTSIPGVTASFRRDWYTDPVVLWGAFAGGLGISLMGVLMLLRRRR
jgi:plastocyanin